MITKYEIYLSTDKFDQKRQAVLNRDNHKCVVCGKTTNLQIHHLTYMHVYDEPLDDLITLCDVCHSTYHNIQRRQELVEKMYRNEREDQWKEEEAERKHIAETISNEIKEEYLQHDYSQNGNYDMCDWAVLTKIIDDKASKYGFGGYYIVDKTSLRNWFLCRRYERLLYWINSGIEIERVKRYSKFSGRWISRWYNREKLEAKLEEEKFLLNKEDTK